MLYMNEYDISQARGVAEFEEWKVTLGAIEVLERLVEWTNDHSDGWAYWPKPCNAARQLQERIQEQEAKSRMSSEQYDMTYNDRDLALRPIKAFLTRQGVDAKVKAWIIDGIVGEPAPRIIEIKVSPTDMVRIDAAAKARGLDVDPFVNQVIRDYVSGATR